VTQNWSLDCKIEVCWKTKIGARFVEFGARFWLPVGGFWFVKTRRPNGGIRGPILHEIIFQNVCLGQICYNFMRVTFTINIDIVLV